MNNLIKNIKGNQGYMIGYWNTQRTACLTFFEKRSEVQVIIRFVEVASCGKKQMTLIDLEDGEKMSGELFSPSQEIHADLESAQIAADALLDQIVANTIEYLEEYVKNEKNPSHLAKYQYTLTRFKADDLPRRAVGFGAALAALRA